MNQRLRKIRQVRHWMTVFLIGVAVFLFFSLNARVSYRDNDPPLAAISDAIQDLPYCSGKDKQTLDLYLPIDSTLNDRQPPYPLVIYIHGGGWRKGDKRNTFIDYYGSGLSRAGFAVASVNYRLAPTHRYPTQNKDVSCAINELASIAADYELDISRTILFGDSAGSLLASDYILSVKQKPIVVRGMISFYGTTDLVSQLQHTKRNPNAHAYLGTFNDSVARKASPLYKQIQQTPPPFLFFHGTKDNVVSIEQAYKFYQRISSHQPSSRFIRVIGAGHGFSGDSRTTKPTSDEMRRTLVSFALRQVDNIQGDDSQSDTIILDNN